MSAFEFSLFSAPVFLNVSGRRFGTHYLLHGFRLVQFRQLFLFLLVARGFAAVVHHLRTRPTGQSVPRFCRAVLGPTWRLHRHLFFL